MECRAPALPWQTRYVGLALLLFEAERIDVVGERVCSSEGG